MGSRREAVLDAIRAKICTGQEEAFMMTDVDDVEAKVVAWRQLLPRVEPFYAVKCNDDEMILARMVELGLSFDCASRREIDKVMRLGAAPTSIVYAHPCKPPAHLAYSRKVGVEFTTFDNHDELHKLKQVHPQAKLLLRLLPDDSSAICQLGVKFGADLAQVPSLLRTALALGLDVCGVSYHCGSGCRDINAFADAVHLARAAFDIAASLGMSMSLLDIGGGFPGQAVDEWASAPTTHSAEADADSAEAVREGGGFPAIALRLRSTLDELFPASSGVRIIAEPGRYLVHSSGTMAVNIIGRRQAQPEPKPKPKPKPKPEPKPAKAEPVKAETTEAEAMKAEAIEAEAPPIRYYVNDGVYGAFNNIIYDHAAVTGFPLDGATVTNENENENESPEDAVSTASDASTSIGSYGSTGSGSSGPSGSGGPSASRGALLASSVWGPTCDGLDCILEKTELPLLDVGDWLVFPDMGAYTISAASGFNGFDVAETFYVPSPGAR